MKPSANVVPLNATVTLEKMIERTKAAQKRYSTYTQEQVDHIVFQAALATNHARIPLAKLAVEETGMGIVEDKVIKNHFASEEVYHRYRDTKTCDIIERNEGWGIYKVASPMGVVAGVIPVTNPTSTIIFKALLALKTRNAVVFSPHPSAKRSSLATVKLILEAAVKAGAPNDILACIEEPNLESTQHLLQHSDIAVILATGGPGMVHSAYSSGNPAIGVGPGNTPAVIDETADLQMAVSSIVLSKTFDNGVVCASEQTIVAVDEIYKPLKKELTRQGGHFLSPEEQKKLAKTILVKGQLNAKIVGQSARHIAELAGIDVPEDTKILIGETDRVGADEAFCQEKLSPILGIYRERDFKAAVTRASELLAFAGEGHTSVLYTNEGNTDRIEEFGKRMNTARILINIPGSQGAIGDLYNFHLEPALTLGCGSWGKNSVSGNIRPEHLLNIKTVAERRENMLWFRVPPRVFFKTDCLTDALGTLKGYKRAFVITDGPIAEMGLLEPVKKTLRDLDIKYTIFSEVAPDPNLSTVKAGLKRLNNFDPDVIIAVGGGSPMDAAKIMWLMHDNPGIRFTDLAMRFMDIRKRIYSHPEFPEKKTLFVAIPTTSGTGSEVSPFSVITDDKNGDAKYPIADYAITPDVAIIDPALVMGLPKSLTASGGLDAVTHAIEAFVSPMATDFSQAQAKRALTMLFEYLPRAYQAGSKDRHAREQVHFAATIAGMAFANASLGVVHSMAHKLGTAFHIAHGVACSLFLTPVIRYNATDKPTKLVGFSQYKTPDAIARYAEIATDLGLSGSTPMKKVEALIHAIDELRTTLELPMTIQEAGVPEDEFLAAVDELADHAFDDQCTPTNPRYPLISEIRDLFIAAYYGRD